MKPFLFGTGILLAGLIIGMFKGDLEFGVNFSGIIGIGLLIISGVLSGAFISGDRIRANISTSPQEDLNNTRKWGFVLMMTGMPGFIAAVVYHAFVK